jgi:hypothetical protein
MKLTSPVEGKPILSLVHFKPDHFRTFVQIIWVAVVLLLPLTSLPLLVDISGATTVAPPSNLLLLLVVLIWFIPYLLLRGRIPLEGSFFLLFLVAVVISFAAAVFIETPIYRGRSFQDEAPEAFSTLIMAAAAYLVAATWLFQDRKNLKLTIILVNLSGLALLIWSILQAGYVILSDSSFPAWMSRIQHLFVSGSNPLFSSRISGLAYEPSWLAHQLNMVYLPVWLAATLSGYTAHRFKLGRVSLENLLLLCGVFALVMSFSRVGWLSFLLVIAFVAVGFIIRQVNRIHRSVQEKRVSSGKSVKESKVFKIGLSISLLTSFFLLFVILVTGLIYFGSQIDPRLGRIVQTNPFKSGERWLSFYEVTNQLAFAERVVYWHSGWQIFNDHPFFGVGLGNAGFYFKEKMPAFGWGLTEVSVLLNRLDHIPNTKAIWARLLAETGLVGTAVFLGWLFIQWKSTKLCMNSEDPLFRMIGLAGKLVFVGFMIEGFSVDSFALPYFWFSMGLVTATGGLVRKSLRFSEDVQEVRAHG